MRIEQLENSIARERFLSEGKGAYEQKSSEGLLHERQDYLQEDSMVGFRESPEATRGKSSMREIFRVENSYGTISLGLNDKKEKALVIRRKYNKNGPTVSRDQMELDEELSYRYDGHAGERKLNRFSPVSSAFVLKNTDQNKAENNMMGHVLMKECLRFGNITGQHTLLSILPGDRSELQTISERMDISLRRELEHSSDNEGELSLRNLPEVESGDKKKDSPDEDEAQDDDNEDKKA